MLGGLRHCRLLAGSSQAASVSEWYANEKPSGPYQPPAAEELEPDVSFTDDLAAGDLTPGEISALSRAGYGRNDGDGRFWNDDDKKVVKAAAVTRDKGEVLKGFNKPSPAYSVAHDNGGQHFTS